MPAAEASLQAICLGTEGRPLLVQWSLQIPHMSPLLFIQQHSWSTCSTQACGGYADASCWQKLRTLSYDIQLDLRHFPDRQGRCNPLTDKENACQKPAWPHSHR